MGSSRPKELDQDFSKVEKEFDWRIERPDCLSLVQAQGSCGACYAFASAAMLSERHCIQNDLVSSADLLSAEAIISCDALDFGCNGGHLEKTMEFLED